MKKLVTAIICCLLICGMALSLTSCTKTLIDSGKYQAANGQIIEITYETMLLSESVKNDDGEETGVLVIIYDYFIENGKITLTFDNIELLGEGVELDAMRAYCESHSTETFTYEKIDGGFIMGGTEFKKI